MSEATLLREAWAEADRLRAFIRSIEWSGSVVVDYDGVTAPCCPACGQFRPEEDYGTVKPSERDHKTDCALVAALAPRPTSAPIAIPMPDTTPLQPDTYAFSRGKKDST